MEQVEVEITGLVITARYGTLKTGDILRTDKEFADHLVNDCGGAKLVASKVSPVVAKAPAKANNKPKK
jgi:hypothetical protein